MRLWLRERIDRTQTFIHNWKEKHPRWLLFISILSWLILFTFIISLFFFESNRRMGTQFLWSLYLLLQFWLLARSKTLTWKTYTGFFFVGGLVIPPLTNLIVLGIHGIAGGETTDLWSVAIVTPILEEVLKLLPLVCYVYLSRKASSLSIRLRLNGGSNGSRVSMVGRNDQTSAIGRHHPLW